MKGNDKAIITKTQDLWRQGVKYRDISEELGVGISTVNRYIHMAPDYVPPEPRDDRAERVNKNYWSLEEQEQISWKWPVTVNLIRRRCGMDPQPVPEHDRDEEIKWLGLEKKPKRRRLIV